MLRIAVLVSVLSGSALADDATRRLDVAVDNTIEVDVGYLIGFRCDDQQLVEASMTTRDNRNVFVVKGKAAGRTLCRVGTNPFRPSMLFDVVVSEKKVRAPKRGPR